MQAQSISPTQKAPRTRGRRQHAGFDLIQISIVIAVMAVLMAGAFAGVPPVLARLRAAQEAQDLNAYVHDQDLMPFSTIGDITNEVCSYRLYPEPGCVGGGVIRNRFGADVKISRSNQSGEPIITVLSPSVPSRVCTSLVPMVALTFDAISIGPVGAAGTPVKPLNGTTALDPASVNKLCNTSPFVTLQYQIHAL